MATKSKSKQVGKDETVSQGDIFRNVKYSYLSSENDNSVDMIEYEFPYAIVISQACDTQFTSSLFEAGAGKPTKFMPSILMCPIYNSTMVREGTHIEEVFEIEGLQIEKDKILTSSDRQIIEKDWHYRFHKLDVENGKRPIFQDSIIDFKHYFTVPMRYLNDHKENRVIRLESVYAQQITLKFSVYLSRVAIPSQPNED